MYLVDVYLRIRRAVMVEGMSIREASRVFGLHRDTVRKMLAYSAPPGYRRQTPPRRPKLQAFTGVIDRILDEDRRVPRKQRHTAKRIFERLRDEYGFDGGYTVVKDYVREHRRQTKEMFVPLSHPPGHAQCDFGEALVVIGGVEQKAHCFVLDLPHSDGCFVKAYSAETTEAFLDGHVSAFAFLGGIPQSILYDNTKLAVARILGDGKRQRTRAFTELQSHYLFDDRFGRPGKGNDKGKVEGLVGYARRNFLVPIPSFESFEALNVLPGAALSGADGRPAPGTRRDHWAADGAGPGSSPAPASSTLRRLRQAGGEGEFPVPGPVPDQRLLSAGGLRAQGRAGQGLCGSGGHQLRFRGHRKNTRAPASATTSSSTPSTTCRCWSGRREPWIRPRRCRGGICPRSSARCAGCWSPAWAGGANGSTSRCSGCWRPSPSRRWLRR